MLFGFKYDIYDVLGDAALRNYDRDLWELAFKDLSMELIINKVWSISEVLTTVVEFVRGLDYKVSFIFKVPQCFRENVDFLGF